jgi:hypothetical protein
MAYYEETYRLGSAEMIHAPGIVRWAVNGYRFPKDRKILVRLIADGWNIPDDAAIALLSGASPYVIEDGDFVVFKAPARMN